jgi:hypothetical protein
MIAVPVVSPVTTPVPLMVATDGDRLLHVPAVEVSLSVVVSVEHNCMVPVIAPGNGFTVIGTVNEQPADNV